MLGGSPGSVGLYTTNANGTVELRKLITAVGGRVEDQFLMKFGANEAKGLVAGYVARDGEPGATTVRRSRDRKSISFHLGHLFEKYPTLRPPGEVYCTLKLGKESKGTPCVVVNLRGGSIKNGRGSAEPEVALVGSEHR